MALTKIKLDDVDPKATPVLADSFVMSDSEDGGRGKLVTGTALEEMIATGDTLSAALAGKAPLESPAFTGTPTGPTAAKNANTTQLSTTAFVTGAVAACRPKHAYTAITTASTAIAAKRNNTYGVNANGCTLTLPAYNSAGYVDGDEICVVVGFTALRELTIVSPSYILRGTGLQPNNTPFNLTGFGTFISFTKCLNVWVMSYPGYELAAATANAIYDLPVTRSGLVSPGTDKIIFETSTELNPAWYDTTHVLNVSLFARNDSGVSDNTTFKVQLYDAGTSTAYTIASITADTLDYNLLQASIYREPPNYVFCSIQYGIASSTGYVSLASGSYKLRVVCTSTLETRFSAAQVRFTK